MIFEIYSFIIILCPFFFFSLSESKAKEIYPLLRKRTDKTFSVKLKQIIMLFILRGFLHKS